MGSGKETMTPEEFVKILAPMLQEFIEAQYGEGETGEVDLITASCVFMDAASIMIHAGFEYRS